MFLLSLTVALNGSHHPTSTEHMQQNHNIGCLFDPHVAHRGNAVAITQGEMWLDYQSLDARTNQVAQALRAMGVLPGQPIGVLIKNDLRYVESVFGALRCGAVVVPVTTRSTFDTLQHVLTDSEAIALIASSEFEHEAKRLLTTVPTLRWIRVLDATDAPINFDDWRNHASSERLCQPRAPGDDALLCYTSGSTGRAKGVPLSHAGVAWCAQTMRRALLLKPDDRCLLAVPLFHANATTCGLWPMLEGGGSVVILKDFDARQVLTTMSEMACTFTTGVPAMYKLLLREQDLLESLDFRSLRFVLCSSSQVPVEMLKEFEARFHIPMIEGYGLTEGGPMVLSNPRWGIAKSGRSGLPLPGVSIRIADPDSPLVDVAPGAIGELLVNSPGVTRGYHHLRALDQQRRLPGGWIRTRDLARRDEEGYVQIVGRVDDLIICGGENIYPTQVENLLLTHPNVIDAAVLAREDSVKGQVPIAFVVTRAGTALDGATVKAYTLQHGPAWAHPRDVYVLDELPLNAAKKVDRAALLEMLKTVSQ